MYADSTHKKVLVSAFALGLGISSLAQAGETCEHQDTAMKCFERGFASVAQANETAKVEAKSTGTTTELGGLGSSLTNFLPRFIAAIDSGQLNEAGQILAFDLSSQLISKNKNFKLQMVVNDAELFGSLKMALPEENRDALTGELEGQLNELDDVSYILSWSPHNGRWGRDLESRRETFTRLHSEATGPGPYFDAAMGRFVTDFKKLLKAPALADGTTLETVIGARSDFKLSEIQKPELAQQIMKEMFELGRSAARTSLAVKEDIKKNKLDQFYQLVNNQPQLVVTAEQRERSGLTGPDLTTFKVAYEFGVNDVNGLERYCKKKEKEMGPSLLSCYRDHYLTDPGRLADLEANNRFSFSLEYVERDAFDVMLTNGFSFSQEKSESVIAEVEYGRYLWVSEDGQENGRFDLSASYEDVDDDPMRQSRFLASATYTYKLNDQVSTLVGLKWANKSEFLGDVDEELSSRLGLVFKVDSKKNAAN